MAVVAILSHGENGSIICTNGEKVMVVKMAWSNHNRSQVPVEDILSKFNNREAPPLKGKPKFFIFQSCRGLKIDPGVDTDGLDDNMMVGMDRMVHHPNFQQRLPDQDLEIVARDPSYEDIFVSYATIPTYVAYRNNMKGSWYDKVLIATLKYWDLPSPGLSSAFARFSWSTVARRTLSASWRGSHSSSRPIARAGEKNRSIVFAHLLSQLLDTTLQCTGERDSASRSHTSPFLQPWPGGLPHPVHQPRAGEGGQRDGDLHRVFWGGIRPPGRHLVRYRPCHRQSLTLLTNKLDIGHNF